MRRVDVRFAAAAVVLVTVALSVLPGTVASASPAGPASTSASLAARAATGAVPAYRTDGAPLLVCGTDQADFANRVAGFADDLKAANLALWDQCQATGFHDVQAAVDQATTPGVTIKILPGDYGPVTIAGIENLQLEGTGAAPGDVVLDAAYQHDAAITVDAAPGTYLKNLTAQRTTGSAVAIANTDGFAVDTVIGRWNDDNGILARATDHGLITACDTYGNGAAGIAVDASADLNAQAGDIVIRYAVEIHGCHSHDNLQGYAGTTGDSVWAHDNVLDSNAVGAATGSLAAAPHQSGLPQNHALFEGNIIASTNENFYGYVRDGTCAQPSAQRGYEQGVVCPATGVPTGTGVLTLGGDYDLWRGNWIYDNAYAAFVTTWLPGALRGDRNFPDQFDTSHHDRYIDNALGTTVQGDHAPNGLTVWWDGEGVGSCWQKAGANGSSKDGTEPLAIPSCDNEGMPAGAGTARYVGEPLKLLTLHACLGYDLATASIPTDCSWYGATGLHRIEVKWALGEAIVLAVLLILLTVRVVRRSGAGRVGLVVTLGGLATGVLGVWWEGSIWGPIGLALTGFGWVWVGVALYRSGRPGRGFITIALGAFGLLGALDTGVVMIPYIPVPPSTWRIVIELFWAPIALYTIIRNKKLRRGKFPASEEALLRYTQQLRF